MVLREVLLIYDPIIKSSPNLGLGEVGTLVDTGTRAVNDGIKVPIYGCVIGAVIVRAVVEAVTPISVETDMAMVSPMVVDTVAPTKGADTHVNCACDEVCDDCDDIEAPILVDLVIIFIVLPLLKCMHKNANFSLEKVYRK